MSNESWQRIYGKCVLSKQINKRKSLLHQKLIRVEERSLRSMEMSEYGHTSFFFASFSSFLLPFLSSPFSSSLLLPLHYRFYYCHFYHDRYQDHYIVVVVVLLLLLVLLLLIITFIIFLFLLFIYLFFFLRVILE